MLLGSNDALPALPATQPVQPTHSTHPTALNTMHPAHPTHSNTHPAPLHASQLDVCGSQGGPLPPPRRPGAPLPADGADELDVGSQGVEKGAGLSVSAGVAAGAGVVGSAGGASGAAGGTASGAGSTAAVTESHPAAAVSDPSTLPTPVPPLAATFSAVEYERAYLAVKMARKWREGHAWALMDPTGVAYGALKAEEAEGTWRAVAKGARKALGKEGVRMVCGVRGAMGLLVLVLGKEGVRNERERIRCDGAGCE